MPWVTSGGHLSFHSNVASFNSVSNQNSFYKGNCIIINYQTVLPTKVVDVILWWTIHMDRDLVCMYVCLSVCLSMCVHMHVCNCREVGGGGRVEGGSGEVFGCRNRWVLVYTKL